MVTDDYLRLSGYSEEFLQYLDGAFLDDVDQFDYKFFRLSPKEASLMDPCHRLFCKPLGTQSRTLVMVDSGLWGSNTGVLPGLRTATITRK